MVENFGLTSSSRSVYTWPHFLANSMNFCPSDLGEPECKNALDETGDFLEDLAKILVQDFPNLLHIFEVLDVGLDLSGYC